MKKFFTLVFGVLFAMCANAVTSDIGAPSNNIKDVKANQVFFNPETNVISFYKSGIIAQVGGLEVRITLNLMSLF